MHEGHRQRMLDRCLKGDLSSLQDHELIEVLMYNPIARANTNETAHKLLKEFGSIGGVLGADPSALSQVEGVGKKSAAYFAALNEALRRAGAEKEKPRTAIKTINQAVEHLRSRLAGVKNERVYILCLDIRSRLLGESFISEGTLTSSPIYVRKIAQEAFKFNAAKVILVHNHPGGKAKPSIPDIDVTEYCAKHLEALEIQLLDHIIVSEDGFASVIEYARNTVYKPAGGDKAAQYDTD